MFFSILENAYFKEQLTFLHQCCEEFEDISLLQRVDKALKQLKSTKTAQEAVSLMNCFYELVVLGNYNTIAN